MDMLEAVGTAIVLTAGLVVLAAVAGSFIYWVNSERAYRRQDDPGCRAAQQRLVDMVVTRRGRRVVLTGLTQEEAAMERSRAREREAAFYRRVFGPTGPAGTFRPLDLIDRAPEPSPRPVQPNRRELDL